MNLPKGQIGEIEQDAGRGKYARRYIDGYSRRKLIVCGSPVFWNHPRIARRVGLEGVRLHDLRHTHASLMFREGVHPKIVQERLGHATMSTAIDIYSHLLPGMQEAAEKFDRGLREKVKRGRGSEVG